MSAPTGVKTCFTEGRAKTGLTAGQARTSSMAGMATIRSSLLMGIGTRSIAVKAGTGTTLTGLTMWTAAARRKGCLVLLLEGAPWPIAPVQSGQDRRITSTYRGVL